jgi:hypothetical protein
MISLATLVFAYADAGDLFWLFILAVCAWGAYQHMKERHDEAELRKQDPAAWVELQRLQHEKEKMEHERKQSVLNIGGTIGGMLLNRFLKR